jgi:hypothetical protein
MLNNLHWFEKCFFILFEVPDANCGEFALMLSGFFLKLRLFVLVCFFLYVFLLDAVGVFVLFLVSMFALFVLLTSLSPRFH